MVNRDQRAPSRSALRPDVAGGRNGHPMARATGFVALVAVLAWAGWQIIVNTAADSAAEIDPAAALTLRPDLATGRVTLAQQNLINAKTAAEIRAARAEAEAALAVSPLSPSALQIIGIAADLLEDHPAARAAMRLAGDANLHDTVSQIWLFDQDIHEGNVTDALARGDIMLRTRPDLTDKLLPALASLAAMPDAKEAILTNLGSRPPWRAQFLSRLPGVVDNDIAYSILAGLADGPAPPTSAEVSAYVDHLVGAGDFELAYVAWLHFLPQGEAATVSFAYNGGFEKPISGAAFDWRASPISGATTDTVDTGETDHGRALRVTFANTRVPYHNLSKLMILPPGHYQISGEAKADNLVNDRGMAWQIECAEGEKAMLVETKSMVGTLPWTAFSSTFDVPPSGCRAQSLTLVLAAKINLEQQVSGEIWYDNVSVSRIEPAT